MKKYFELITIPVAVLLLMAYNALANWLGLYVFTWEMFGKVFVAFLIFLVAMGFVRLVFIFLFPQLYRYFDLSFNHGESTWKSLSEKERLLYAVFLYSAMLLFFGLIVNGL
jgi:membrane protein YdbS with pleckstrin-like domain